MKICIPTIDDRGFDSTVSDHFGRAPFFAMVDLAGGEPRFVPNPACHQHAGSCHHAPLLKAHHVDAAVGRGIGRGAAAGLGAAGIAVLVAGSSTVSGVLDEVRRGAAVPTTGGVSCGAAGCGHAHRHGHGRDPGGPRRDGA